MIFKATVTQFSSLTGNVKLVGKTCELGLLTPRVRHRRWSRVWGVTDSDVFLEELPGSYDSPKLTLVGKWFRDR
ncbi:hypothetical protein F383_05385 [Gossypium arboreum]|uniref:Uncharacterized protein n=1 Tax=Gossypium arboreum TaxID=29729 RepID=A0A0B0NUA6_GOSAR|nr:hypothetical protein F383_05385 [Gossypium arboreum]